MPPTADKENQVLELESYPKWINTKLMYRGVSIEDFGGIGDGVADDTKAVIACYNYCKDNNLIMTGSKKYRLTSTVNLRYIPINMTGSFFIDHNEIGVILGGNASNPKNPTQSIFRVDRVGGYEGVEAVNPDSSSGSITITTKPDVRIIGAKGQVINLDYAYYIQLYADTNSNVKATDYSIAYSEFHFVRATILELTTNMNTNGTTSQWINENTFFLKRSKNLVMSGTYNHNHNIFHCGTFEGDCFLDFQCGSSNRLYNARFEGLTQTINLSNRTWGNVIEQSWSSNKRSPMEKVQCVINDNGTSNQVIRETLRNMKEFTLLDINEDNFINFRTDTTFILNQESNMRNVNLEVKGIKSFTRGSSRPIFKSGFIEVSMGDVIQFDSTSGLRIKVNLFDANRVLMTSNSHPDINPGSNLFDSYITRDPSLNAYTPETGTFTNQINSNPMIIVNNNNVKYIRFELLGPGSSEVIRKIKVVLRSTNSTIHGKNLITNQLPALSASPKKGFAPLGYKLSNVVGGWFTCSFSLETVNTSQSESGSNQIILESTAGVTAGDIIGIGIGDDAHWSTVSSVSDKTVTIGTPIPLVVPTGNTVVINRWINS